LYTISLTDFVGMDIAAFAVSILPGPPTGVVGVEAVTSPLAWADFDASLPAPSEPDAADEDDVDGDDGDDDDDEYRTKLDTQQRDWENDCEIGRKFAAW